MIDPRSALLPVKSPLALIGLFLEILRYRFGEGQQLDWAYFPGDEGRNASTIMIEAGGNPDVEEYLKRPAIFVNRGPIQINQPVLNDTAGVGPRQGIKAFYATAETNFVFTVEAEPPGEAERIADIVLSTLLMGASEIRDAFNFRKLGPFALSSRTITRAETEFNQVSVNMGLGYDVQWRTLPIAPILKEVIVKARNASYTSDSDFFTEIYQSSLRHSPNSAE